MFIYETSTIALDTIEIFGVLEFENNKEKSFSLSAKKIYVRGGLYAGDEKSEFESELTITLTGDLTDDDYVIIDLPKQDGIQMGSKALGT